MYPETRRAVRRVLRICDILWSLDEREYADLLCATDAVEMPDRQEAVKKASEILGENPDPGELSKTADDLILKELRGRYVEAARQAGFGSEHGLAMLEYATMLMDLDDDEGDIWDANTERQ
jgi:hypothetical protein